MFNILQFLLISSLCTLTLYITSLDHSSTLYTLVYPIKLLSPVTAKSFVILLNKDYLQCFGNIDYLEPTYLTTAACFMNIPSVDCNMVWGSRSVNIEIVNETTVEVFRVHKIPKETASLSIHRSYSNHRGSDGNFNQPSSKIYHQPFSIKATRWFQADATLDSHRRRVVTGSSDEEGGLYKTGHGATDKQEQTTIVMHSQAAEPIYLCARTPGWKFNHYSPSESSLNVAVSSNENKARIHFKPAYTRENDRSQTLKKLVLHLILITALSSRWLIPYVVTCGLLVWLATTHMGMVLYAGILVFSCCIVTLTPFMLTKHNRHIARLYIAYFFTRNHEEETRLVVRSGLPLFQSLYFSSLVVCFGSAFAYFIHIYCNIDRELRNILLQIFVAIALGWFCFCLCRYFDSYCKKYFWVGCCILFINVIQHHINYSCRNEAFACVLGMSYVIKCWVMDKWVLPYMQIPKLVRLSIPKFLARSTSRHHSGNSSIRGGSQNVDSDIKINSSGSRNCKDNQVRRPALGSSTAPCRNVVTANALAAAGCHEYTTVSCYLQSLANGSNCDNESNSEADVIILGKKFPLVVDDCCMFYEYINNNVHADLTSPSHRMSGEGVTSVGKDVCIGCLHVHFRAIALYKALASKIHGSYHVISIPNTASLKLKQQENSNAKVYMRYKLLLTRGSGQTGCVEILLLGFCKELPGDSPPPLDGEVSVDDDGTPTSDFSEIMHAALDRICIHVIKVLCHPGDLPENSNSKGVDYSGTVDSQAPLQLHGITYLEKTMETLSAQPNTFSCGYPLSLMVSTTLNIAFPIATLINDVYLRSNGGGIREAMQVKLVEMMAQRLLDINSSSVLTSDGHPSDYPVQCIVLNEIYPMGLCLLLRILMSCMEITLEGQFTMGHGDHTRLITTFDMGTLVRCESIFHHMYEYYSIIDKRIVSSRSVQSSEVFLQLALYASCCCKEMVVLYSQEKLVQELI